MTDILSHLRIYDVSETLGFLPTSLSTTLPCPYYSLWELVAATLPDLLRDGAIRETVMSLPLLETKNLVKEDEWRRAYVILGYLSNAYLFSSTPPVEILPLCLSQPMIAVSNYLGLPPVPTYSGQTLWNYTVSGLTNVYNGSNIVHRPISFTGSTEEAAFFSISVAIEKCGAPLIPALLAGIQAAKLNDSTSLISCLRDADGTLKDMATLLSSLSRDCSPEFFYFTLRPYLEGTGDLKSVGLPEGIFYEQCSGGAFQRYRGPSNAQSSLFAFIDIALGVKHYSKDNLNTRGSARSNDSQLLAAKEIFIKEMRGYMPRGHCEFLTAVEREPNIGTFVHAQSHDMCLGQAYTACLDSLTRFRNIHIQLVTRYIVLPAKKGKAIVKGTASPISIAGANGTGGTQPIEFLKSVRDDVVDACRFEGGLGHATDSNDLGSVGL